MSVNWSWKHKLGEVHYYSKKDKLHWKLNMYGGNMMCCFLYEYKEEQEDGTYKDMYNFFFWLNDIAHAKRVLKQDKTFFKHMAIGNHTLRYIKLKVTSKDDKYSNKEMLEFGKLLAEYGYQVRLY